MYVVLREGRICFYIKYSRLSNKRTMRFLISIKKFALWLLLDTDVHISKMIRVGFFLIYFTSEQGEIFHMLHENLRSGWKIGK